MNNQIKYSDDPLSQYINSDKVEKAPEGFTSKVMASVQLEAMPLRTTNFLRKIGMIPVISVSVTIVLILAALFIPANETALSFGPVVDFIKNLKISLPEYDIKSIISFNPSEILIYVVIGIIILSLFDMALNMLFHKDKG